MNDYINTFYNSSHDKNYENQLKLYDQGKNVELLQKNLIKLEFLRGIPNGIFGLNTKRAVENFQFFYNLPVTGVIDSETSKEIVKALDNPFPSTRPTIKIEDQGVMIKLLEKYLIILGFLDRSSTDGIFSNYTENAVINFQTARNLTPDGIVGPRTWREINNMLSAVLTPLPTIKPDIQINDKNDYVILLQNLLNSYGYLKNGVTEKFDEETENAVIKLQKTYGLNQTGIVDYFTWEVLDSMLNPNFINTPLLQEGSTAPEVLILQEKLKVAGYFSGTITGSFGPETTHSVESFQKSKDLPITGIIDRETWITLFNETAILNRNIQTEVLNRPTLRYGDEGFYVEKLQEELKTIMFYDGVIDGKFGNKTLESVKNFQINNKLTADGIVGRQTWSSLIYLYSPLAICRSGTSNWKGVVIDPGHGGTDPGAISSDIIEKEYNLKISQYMNNRFKELGITSFMTRNTDETLSQQERIRRMKEPFGDVKNAIVISNHINAGGVEGKNVTYF